MYNLTVYIYIYTYTSNMYVANYGGTVANYGSVYVYEIENDLFETPSSKLSKLDCHRVEATIRILKMKIQLRNRFLFHCSSDIFL